ncbi:hypothetical protein [Vallitalea okinawensis]|uniref:hypothetical protein n=1 Tax=Vallitalea okinawensis TaxID=2078660 RepID=UPI001FA82C05
MYVSCDSATLARVFEYLVEYGFDVGEVQSVEMFPHTTHVETVVQLTRKEERKPTAIFNKSYVMTSLCSI